MEKAYSVYGEGKGNGGSGDEPDPDPVDPLEKLEGMAVELEAAIAAVNEFLQEVGFDIESLIHADGPTEKLARLTSAANAICLNETVRSQFEVSARNVFRKYKALYPEVQAKPFTRSFNAIEAIYNQLNKKVMAADISDVISRLQQEVNMSISLDASGVGDDDAVDLSTLDFDRLRAAFAKSEQKNQVVFDLQEAIEKKLQKMIQQNPVRLEFYERYKEIISEYNAGKDIQAVQKAFDDLNEFLATTVTPETERAMRQGLDEETLAIYDLLRKPSLSKKEEEAVKKVAKTMLSKLKEEKLKVERWRESTQVSAQVKVLIDHELEWLPQETYPDEELADKSLLVYQHVYGNYQGGGYSTYGYFGV